jgi:membrane-associated phospholipid phosphatase
MTFPLPAARGPFAAAGELSRAWLLPSRTMRRRLWPPAIGLGYIAVIAAIGGLNAHHVLLGSLGLLDAYNPKTRLFLRTFLPFIATGAIYDSLRYYLAAGIAGRVHVAGPYALDRAWFGFAGHTLNEVFEAHHWEIADLIAGSAYLIYVIEYLALAILLFFTGHVPRALTFARCFFVVNAMGFITYFAYPAAPPWYVTAHGLGPVQGQIGHIAPSPGAATRFDALVGTDLFASVYSRSVEVFGAIPSLHVAYPLMAAILAFHTRELRWARWPAAGYVALMCFSAVYLQHHYVIDVLIGLAYAVIAVIAVRAWERRTTPQGFPRAKESRGPHPAIDRSPSGTARTV